MTVREHTSTRPDIRGTHRQCKPQNTSCPLSRHERCSTLTDKSKGVLPSPMQGRVRQCVFGRSLAKPPPLPATSRPGRRSPRSRPPGEAEHTAQGLPIAATLLREPRRARKRSLLPGRRFDHAVRGATPLQAFNGYSTIAGMQCWTSSRHWPTALAKPPSNEAQEWLRPEDLEPPEAACAAQHWQAPSAKPTRGPWPKTTRDRPPRFGCVCSGVSRPTRQGPGRKWTALDTLKRGKVLRVDKRRGAENGGKQKRRAR